MAKYWKWIIVVALIGLGKLSGFLKDILITFYHGVSPVTDAYFLSGSISSFLYMAIYASIPVLLVPLYSRIVSLEDKTTINRDLSSVYGFFFLISFLIAGLVLLTSPFIVDKFADSISTDVRSLTVKYLTIMSVTFVLSTAVAIYNCIQTVNGNVYPSYIVPLINNLFFCFGLVVFSTSENFYKILILSVVSWFILAIFNHYYSRKYFTFDSRSSTLFFSDKKFLLLFFPAAVSFFIEYANGFVGVYFATELKAGAISVLGYSNKLNMLLLSVFLVFLTTTLFPKIANVVTQSNMLDLKSYILKCIRLVIVLGFPVVIFIVFYSENIVSLVFERGKFLKSDTLSVSSIFSIVIIGLLFSLVRDILNRVYFSFNNTFIPMVVTLISLIINYLISYNTYSEFGLKGLASASVISLVINSFAMIYFVQNKIKMNITVELIKYGAFVGVGSLLSFCALYLLNLSFSNLWILLVCPYLLVYFLIMYFFNINEVVLVGNSLKKYFTGKYKVK